VRLELSNAGSGWGREADRALESTMITEKPARSTDGTLHSLKSTGSGRGDVGGAPKITGAQDRHGRNAACSPEQMAPWKGDEAKALLRLPGNGISRASFRLMGPVSAVSVKSGEAN